MIGRNQRRSADYFSHDADASMDEKIIYLESKFGHTGYALYFKFLERMTRSADFMLDWNEIKKAVYASEFNVSVTEIEQFVSECCRDEIKAFIKEDNKVFSAGLLARMRPLIEKREYNRAKYEEQKQKNINELANSVTEKAISATELTQERKGKERKGKKRIKTFLSDSVEYRLSELLYSLILKNNPNAKKPNINNWSDHIRLAMECDKRTSLELEAVIRWCQSDPFWLVNILSTKKLREKFDQLWLKMKQGGKNARPEKFAEKQYGAGTDPAKIPWAQDRT